MSLATRLGDLAYAIGTDMKQFRVWITGTPTGTLDTLETTAKDSLVAAINEVYNKPTGDVTQADLDALRESILGVGVPAALDTLDELAAALNDDANFAATMTAFIASIGDPDADLVAVYVAAKA
jgi:hypothetical protein